MRAQQLLLILVGQLPVLVDELLHSMRRLGRLVDVRVSTGFGYYEISDRVFYLTVLLTLGHQPTDCGSVGVFQEFPLPRLLIVSVLLHGLLAAIQRDVAIGDVLLLLGLAAHIQVEKAL